MRKVTVIVLALALTGCASIPESKPQAQHSYTKPAKIVQPAPAAKTEPATKAEPAKKKTFKEKWLSRFFRNRAQ